MNSSLNPFQINIGFLINQPIGYSRVIPFELEQVEVSQGIILNNVQGFADLNRMQDGIRMQASFNGEIESECGRCLITFSNKIQSEFEEIFLFPHMDTTEDELKIPEDGNINIEQIFNDFMVMGIPINPVCKPDCKGLCDVCGQDLNQSACEHHQEKITEEKMGSTEPKTTNT